MCHDVAHLEITLCRCLNTTASYCTGYLGNIRIAPADGSTHFAGWFEAYIGVAWYTIDARNNTPRVGRVLMARERNAADAATSMTCGPNVPEGSKAWPCDLPAVG